MCVSKVNLFGILKYKFNKPQICLGIKNLRYCKVMSDIEILRNPTIRELRNPPAILRRTSSFGEAPVLVKPELEPLPKLSSRWTVLILSGLLLFGNYYAFDLPAALNAPLQKELGVDYEEWQWVLNLMYTYC